MAMAQNDYLFQGRKDKDKEMMENMIQELMRETALERANERNRHVQVKFKQYADEPLNARISTIQHVSIVGGKMSIDLIVDGKETRLSTFDKNCIAAYQSGAVPLNVLANKALESADKLQKETQSEVEKIMAERRGQEQEVARTYHR